MVKNHFVITMIIIFVTLLSSIKVLQRTNMVGEFRSLLKVVEFMLVGTWGCTNIPGQVRAHDRAQNVDTAIVN